MSLTRFWFSFRSIQPYDTIVGGYITKIGSSTDIPFHESEFARIVVDHGKQI
jgi:hypothetical protein